MGVVAHNVIEDIAGRIAYHCIGDPEGDGIDRALGINFNVHIPAVLTAGRTAHHIIGDGEFPVIPFPVAIAVEIGARVGGQAILLDKGRVIPQISDLCPLDIGVK